MPTTPQYETFFMDPFYITLLLSSPLLATLLPPLLLLIVPTKRMCFCVGKVLDKRVIALLFLRYFFPISEYSYKPIIFLQTRKFKLYKCWDFQSWSQYSNCNWAKKNRAYFKAYAVWIPSGKQLYYETIFLVKLLPICFLLV